MNNLVLGPPLERRSGEVSSLVATVLNGTLAAKRVDVGSDGDVRYWDVDISQNPILESLSQFGERCFIERLGKPPAFAYTMVNRIAADTCPDGSGGGWHRDSTRRQYKAFTYFRAAKVRVPTLMTMFCR